MTIKCDTICKALAAHLTHLSQVSIRAGPNLSKSAYYKYWHPQRPTIICAKLPRSRAGATIKQRQTMTTTLKAPTLISSFPSPSSSTSSSSAVSVRCWLDVGGLPGAGLLQQPAVQLLRPAGRVQPQPDPARLPAVLSAGGPARGAQGETDPQGPLIFYLAFRFNQAISG